jgi:hypothetical protein
MTRQLDPQLRAEAAADRDRLEAIHRAGLAEGERELRRHAQLTDLERRARARWTATQKLQHLRPDQRERLVAFFLSAVRPPDWPFTTEDHELYLALGGDPSGLRA